MKPKFILFNVIQEENIIIDNSIEDSTLIFWILQINSH